MIFAAATRASARGRQRGRVRPIPLRGDLDTTERGPLSTVWIVEPDQLNLVR